MGFEVPVDDVSSVSRVERICNLNSEIAHHMMGKRPFLQTVGERLTFQVLDDKEINAVLVADIVQQADVRMRERRHSLGLALEALPQLRVC